MEGKQRQTLSEGNRVLTRILSQSHTPRLGGGNAGCDSVVLRCKVTTSKVINFSKFLIRIANMLSKMFVPIYSPHHQYLRVRGIG